MYMARYLIKFYLKNRKKLIIYFLIPEEQKRQSRLKLNVYKFAYLHNIKKFNIELYLRE